MASGKTVYHKGLNRFTVFTACCTFVLIVAGGLVTSTGSGLAVPDWPLSYGQLMPPMVGGILYEHGHRMIATFVGFLTVILAVWFWKREDRPWVRYLAIGALGAVIAQGILGGLTVLYLLPTAISVSHATLAQTFFVIVSSLALITSRWWMEETPAKATKKKGGISLPGLSLLLVAAVYIQLILGALMRHTGSGLAIPDFPLAYSQLVPSLSPESMAQYNQFLLSNDLRIAADGPILAWQVLIHFLHRVWALVVSGVILSVGLRIFKTEDSSPRLKFLATALVGALLVQITLGAFTVLTQKEFLITTAHVATGAAILVLSVLLSLHAFKYSGVAWGGVVLLKSNRSEALA